MKKLLSYLGFIAMLFSGFSYAQDITAIEVINKAIVTCEAKKPFPVGAVRPEELALAAKDIDALIELYRKQPCYPLRTFIELNSSITHAVIKSSSSAKSSAKSSSVSSARSSSVGPTGPVPIVTVAASTELAGNSPGRAGDGDATTRWESAWQTDPSWLMLDFGQARTVTNIEIDWEASNAKIYTVQGSNDAKTWSDITTKTDGTNGARTDSLPLSGNYRYIRIFCQNRTSASEWGYSIWEVRIKGFGGSSASSSSKSSAAPGVPASVSFTQPNTRENGDPYPLKERGGYLVVTTNPNGKVKTLDIKPEVNELITVNLPFLVAEDEVTKIASYDSGGVYSKFIVVEK